MAVWVHDPHSGGKKIPPAVRARTEQRIQAYAQAHWAGKITRVGIRFRGALCYVEVYTEPAQPSPELLRLTGETAEQYLERQRNLPIPMFRLRYFGDEEAWSVAFYTFSHERYEPSVLPNGSFYATPEQVLEVATEFLPEP